MEKFSIHLKQKIQEYFSKNNEPFNLTTLCKSLSISKPTAHKIILQGMHNKKLQQHYKPNTNIRWYKKRQS